MKRCPQCYEVYEETEKFCEADGQELLANPTLPPVSHTAPAATPAWLPAAALGVLIGVGIGAALSLSSGSKADEPRVVHESPDVRTASTRAATVVSAAPTPESQESPSPTPEAEAQPEASPQVTQEIKPAVAQFNQGPISTGEKTKPNESESGVQTVIVMNDGSTLDVDAAWEDKQGIWYRRSGLVSFVESSRVKAITARKGVTKTPELQDR